MQDGQRGTIAGWRGTIKVPRAVLPGLAEVMRRPGGRVETEVPSEDAPEGLIWMGPVPKAKRPRCRARTRTGRSCHARSVEGKSRCRMHGGLSTGPKTEEGRERIRESNRRRAQARREALRQGVGEC